MKPLCKFALSGWIALFAVSVVAAQDDAPKKKPAAEWVPVPQEMILPQTFVYPPAPPFGSRDIWQYYGVDSTGRWRPRVILAPEGAYDMRTGAPYPWITNRPNAFLPFVLGAPAGSYQPSTVIVQPAMPVMPTVPAEPIPGPPIRFMPNAVD